MWERIALAPFALQSLICPSRSSDTILFGLLAWGFGVCCGSLATALILCPGLRRCLLRGLFFALQEAAPQEHRFDRLQRYRG